MQTSEIRKQAELDLAPYFQYANEQNVSVQHEGERRIYQRCVSCNTERFTGEQIKNKWATFGQHNLHCPTCKDKINDLFQKKLKEGVSDIYYDVSTELYNKAYQ